MKFKVQSAEIKVVEAGKQNEGSEYIVAIVAPVSQFLSATHKTCFFPNPDGLAEWKQQIAAGKLPYFPGKYEVVKTKPFRVKKDGKVLPLVHTDMRVLVMVDPDTGEAIESALAIANQIIDAMMEKAEISETVITPNTDTTVVPTVAVPGVPVLNTVTGGWEINGVPIG